MQATDWFRKNWSAALDQARFEDKVLVIAAHGKPVAVLLSVSRWRRRAVDAQLMPDDVDRCLSGQARTDFRKVVNAAREGRATLLTFRDKEELAVLAPLAMLSADELASATAAA